MNDTRFAESEELLERATEELRARSMAALAPEAVMEGTVLALERQGVILGKQQKRSWNMRKVFGSSLAAGLVLAAVLWMVMQRGSRLAAAEVLENLQKVQSVKMKIETKMKMGGQTVTLSGEMYLDNARGRMRQVYSGREEMVNIFDFRAGKGLLITLNDKVALRVDLAHMPKEKVPQDFLTGLKGLQANPTKVLGEREIEGRKLEGFMWVGRQEGTTTEMTIWADGATKMPVVVEQMIRNGFLPMENRMSEFEWNTALDESLFSLEVPAGYTVKDSMVDFGKPSEKDVVAALKASTAFNDGKFPEGLKTEQLGKAMYMTLKDKQQIESKMGEQRGNMILTARGWAYISDPENGTDWHWAATGVTLGERGRAVLWYKPRGKAMFTVFDADLTVHSEEKEPEVESVEIEVK